MALQVKHRLRGLPKEIATARAQQDLQTEKLRQDNKEMEVEPCQRNCRAYYHQLPRVLNAINGFCLDNSKNNEETDLGFASRIVSVQVRLSQRHVRVLQRLLDPVVVTEFSRSDSR